MKNQNAGKEKNPYASLGGGKIEAPNKSVGEPKAGVIRSTEDLRK